MIKKQSRTKLRQKRHYKMRRYLSGTAECPRLTVFRSNKHIYAQVIDDTIGHTLVSSSTMDNNLAEIKSLTKTSDIEAAKIVGAAVAKKALDKGIKNVVFDRGGCIYHGKIAALADAAREAGLSF